MNSNNKSKSKKSMLKYPIFSFHQLPKLIKPYNLFIPAGHDTVGLINDLDPASADGNNDTSSDTVKSWNVLKYNDLIPFPASATSDNIDSHAKTHRDNDNIITKQIENDIHFMNELYKLQAINGTEAKATTLGRFFTI